MHTREHAIQAVMDIFDAQYEPMFLRLRQSMTASEAESVCHHAFESLLADSLRSSERPPPTTDSLIDAVRAALNRRATAMAGSRPPRTIAQHDLGTHAHQGTLS